MKISKVIVITGASSGIGEATARLLAKEGHKIVLGARSQEKLIKIVSEIQKERGEAIYQTIDVQNIKENEELAKIAIEKYGRIDVWINNAGIMPLSFLAEDKVEDWNKCIDTNIKGVLYGIHACLKIMREQKSGHIINIGFLSSHQTGLACAIYAATKYAVRAISETLRKEEANAKSNIRVTMLAPGMIATNLPQSLTTKKGRDNMQKIYDLLAISPESVAKSISFAINAPEDVSINEIIIRPTSQEL